MEKTRRTAHGEEKASHPRRGEIYLTALDPTLGREIKKTRPALVIQNDTSNRLSEMTIVVPITSTVRFPLNPVHVLLEANSTTGRAFFGYWVRRGILDKSPLWRIRLDLGRDRVLPSVVHHK